MALVVALVSGAAACAGAPEAGRPGSSTAVPAQAPDRPAETWESVPLVGFPEDLGIEAWVWTGRELVGFGGQEHGERPAPATTGGAAYDPETGAWRPIARGAPKGIGDAVWTGSVAVVLAADPDPALRGRAFAYDPAADRWWRLADPPLPAATGLPGLIWTGTEVVASSLLSAWSPVTGQWRPLAPFPPEAAGRSFQSFPEHGAVRFVAADEQLLYRPITDTWETQSTTADFRYATIAPAADGFAALISQPDFGSSRFRFQAAMSTDDRTMWKPIDPPPVVAARCSLRGMAWGRHALFDLCTAIALVDATGRWTVLTPPGPAPRYGGDLIVTDEALYLFTPGTPADDPNHQMPTSPALLRLRAPHGLIDPDDDRPVVSAAIPPDTSPDRSTWTLGSATFDLPPGYRALEPPAVHDDPSSSSLTFTLPDAPPWPPEPPCTITVGPVGPGGASFEALARAAAPSNRLLPRQVVVPDDTVDDRHHVVVQLRDDEVLDIGCDRVFNAAAIVNALR